ncbi:hypothetical protein HMPREF2861_06685 [Lactobacillus sp. HMSC068F07]|nr:hypothetical protein HMPREF2861_06685 [Lactobacillus sp. HMSC068F07]
MNHYAVFNFIVGILFLVLGFVFLLLSIRWEKPLGNQRGITNKSGVWTGSIFMLLGVATILITLLTK